MTTDILCNPRIHLLLFITLKKKTGFPSGTGQTNTPGRVNNNNNNKRHGEF